jgi:hypothetical protein
MIELSTSNDPMMRHNERKKRRPYGGQYVRLKTMNFIKRRSDLLDENINKLLKVYIEVILNPECIIFSV